MMLTGEEIIGKVERETWNHQADTWCSSTKMPLRDVNGEIIGTFGISRDITSQVEIELALARERDMLRALMDHLPDWVFIKDTDFRFVTINKMLLPILHVGSIGDVVGKTDYDFLPAELADRYKVDDAEVLRCGEALIDREETARDADGNLMWLSTSKVPLKDENGEVTGLVGICRNITTRKLAEKKLEQRAFEARLLHEATAMAAETNSLEDALQGCTDIVCELTGWPVGTRVPAR